MEKKVKWEEIDRNGIALTERLKVDGGHLYRSMINSAIQPTQAMAFVPDIDLERYQSHLRDAYNQGLKEADTLACCRHGVAIRLNTCVPCSIERLKESATPSSS